MSTLIYSPAVKVLIKTSRYGIIDVTDDLESGSLTLRENSPSKFSCVLINHRRKYDLVFTPNDTISVQMKRTHWMQMFSGYLDQVPYYSVYPRSVPLSATCTLKQLQFRLWDEGAPESVALLNDVAFSVDAASPDGGLKDRVVALLTKVGGWEDQKIHIGALPSNWLAQIADLYSEVTGKIDVPSNYLGSTATISGNNIGGPTNVNGIGPMTGQLQATEGRATEFAGPNQSTAVGHFALTGEPGLNPTNVWYCAMQWPYQVMQNGQIVPTPNSTPSQRSAAKQWWTNRKILVINPQNNRAVVLRAADWGPNSDKTDAVIDISPEAMEDVLGFNANPRGLNSGHVQIRFAPDDAALGPYVNKIASNTQGAGDFKSLDYHPGTTIKTDTPSDYTIPNLKKSPIAGDFAWGGYSNGNIPASALKKTTVGISLHPIAAEAMNKMVAAAKQDGITLKPTDGYRDLATQVKTKAAKGNLAATPGTSNHGWGMAADMGVGVDHYNGSGYLWLKKNAATYGWVHPFWAEPGGNGPHEPWHWEFWAGLKYVDIPVNGDGSSASGGLGTTTDANGQQLLNTFDWTPGVDVESTILSGPRALMNDSPLLPMIDMLVKTSMRSYMAAPNGDFISWFPDYFGVYGTAGKMIVRDIELANDGFSIVWSDEAMVTHQFAAGSPTGGGVDSLGDNDAARSIYAKSVTMGVASVEFPEIVRALLNVNPDDPLMSGWLHSDVLLKRFGARVNFTPMGTISTPEAEFWLACWMFQRNWSEQFSAQVELTWMPEVYPGMLLQIPTYKFQAYVEQVTHSFNFSQGGWRSDARVIAPSASDGSGLYGLARGVA